MRWPVAGGPSDPSVVCQAECRLLVTNPAHKVGGRIKPRVERSADPLCGRGAKRNPGNRSARNEPAKRVIETGAWKTTSQIRPVRCRVERPLRGLACTARP